MRHCDNYNNKQGQKFSDESFLNSLELVAVVENKNLSQTHFEYQFKPLSAFLPKTFYFI